ncbi:MAG TPA: YraN family protein [Elusimicrobiota bacterium]|nr:YraN family protein [Elusimicrobiota bacterium]
MSLDKGHAAETQAKSYLESKGYVFLAANYRTRYGEVDLVMQEGDALVFVEVKSRKTRAFGAPEEFVTAPKQGKIVKAALEYVKEHRRVKSPLRFDVVAIENGRVLHYENAFESSLGYTH